MEPKKTVCQFCGVSVGIQGADCCRACFLRLDMNTGLPLTAREIEERLRDEQRRASDAWAYRDCLPIHAGGRGVNS